MPLKLLNKLSRVNPWHFLWVSVAISEIFTAFMNISLSLLWWGKIERDLLLIGTIDAFVVSLIVTILIIYFVKHTAWLTELNEQLQREITEREHAELGLRESEDRLRKLSEATFEGIAIAEGGKVIDCNRQFAEIFGYSLSEINGINVSDLVAPEHRELVFQHIKEGYTEAYEFRALQKDGSIIIAEVRGRQITYKGRQVRETVIRDITERKKADKALQQSEKKYRSLFANMTNSFAYHKMVFDENNRPLDYVFLEVNDAFETNTGLKRENIIGKKVTEVIPGVENADPDLISIYGKVASTGEGANFELYFQPFDRWYSVFAYCPAKGYFVAIFDEITERKRAEEALRQSEEKYRLVVENANDAIFIAQDNIVKFPNPRTVELTGYSAEELAEMPFINLIHPEDRDLVLVRHKRRLMGEELPETYSFRVINRSGKELWVQLNTALLTWNEKPATINFLRDVTEHKLAQDRLHQAQKMESVGTLAGGIAHDFNNLLMAIQGRISLVRAGADSSHPHFEHFEGIENYIKNAATLTKQLLGLARGGKYEVKPTDLNGLVDNSAEMFSRTKKEIAIHTKYQEGLWAVEVDRGQIEQVLLNLFVNAWQAMPDGGELYLQTSNAALDARDVKPHGLKPGKFVRVSVTDTGRGMTEETMKKIFDPFFTTKAMARGTGLGLASVYGIMRSHEGIVDVESKIGRGSTFHLYLPASEKEVVEEIESPQEVMEGSETVLLVDDEDMIIDVGKELLETLGYTVLSANNGKVAIEVYQKNRDTISLVILDMIMPGMSGGETYNLLKEVDPAVKVLLSSGYSSDGQAASILEQGCDAFIQKPFKMNELSHKLRDILDRDRR